MVRLLISRLASPVGWLLAVSLTMGLAPAARLAAQKAAPAESASEEKPPQDRLRVEDVVVVTASRTEQDVHHAPAAMTVLSGEEIETSPADDYGDLLRNVPGLNVSQISARDIQVSGRQATGSLTASELVLVDGRTLYLDFLGFVIWDFLPSHPREIKQIEVVRGPGSAVWGANAMTGVINVITKSPKELQGTSVDVGAGELGTLYANLSHAGVAGKLGYKLSGGYYEQGPYDRPRGLIPGSDVAYPDFPNQGTAQPRADLRFDYDASPETVWSFSGGVAGTDGIIHSGIGPFDIKPGSAMSYVKASWLHRAMQVSVFANLLDGEADNLLSMGSVGLPLFLGFESQTYNADLSNTSVLGTRQVLTYGANVRRNDFDLSIAPLGRNRDEVGAFLQDEVLFGDRVRWLVGGRWDDIDPIGSVFSPRSSLLISPAPAHTLRLSFNRAFRAPALIENFLDITLVNILPLPALPLFGLDEPLDFPFDTDVMGYPSLGEEQLTAFEVGYVGSFGARSTFTLSLYRNELEDGIDFFGSAFYSSTDPPPGWPLPPFILDLPQLEGVLPKSFTYRNLGQVVNEGAEASFSMRPSAQWSWFLNYSYQEAPKAASLLNRPPNHRANLGASYNGPRFFMSGNVNFVDEAFWTDVLNFRGTTDSYTQVNLRLGVRFKGDSASLSVVAQNLFDEEVQQHLFGDIIQRKVMGQLRFEF